MLLRNLRLIVLRLVTAKIEVEIIVFRFLLLVEIEVSHVVTTNFVVSEVEGLVLRLDLLLDSLLLDGLHSLQFVILSCDSRKFHDPLHLWIHLVVFNAIVFQFGLVLLRRLGPIVTTTASGRL